MKIRPVGSNLFHADGQTDIRKLVVAFATLQTRLMARSLNLPYKNQPVNAVKGNNRCLF
jgi:hypothetical protein